MNYTLLTNNIARLCRQQGFTPHLALEGSPSLLISTFPAAWLLPPQLAMVEGIKRRKEYYDVTLYLISESLGKSLDQIEQLRAQMEQKLLEIFTLLSQSEGVIVVDALKIAPRQRALTNISESSLTATARVVMYGEQ